MLKPALLKKGLRPRRRLRFIKENELKLKPALLKKGLRPF